MALTSIEAATTPLTFSTTHLVEIKEVIPELQIGSLENPDDVNQAVEIIKNGDIVAAQFRNVFGFWIDAFNETTAKKALLIKRTDNFETKPLASMMFTDQFLRLVDTSLLTQEMQDLVSNPISFQNKTGSLCHLRAPILKDKVHEIPPRILSWQDNVPYMHNLDPHGHEPISNFIQAANNAGYLYLGMTAVGLHSQPEYTEFDQVKRLCEQSESVKLLLSDPLPTHPDVLGSFPIIDLVSNRIIREGHIPSNLVKQLFELDLIIDEKTKPAFYDHARMFTLIDFEGLKPEQVRSATIAIIHSV